MNIRNYIAQGARRRGLDPAAVLAVASVEGGFGGAIGDQGTSYGPFQLHRGGALPHGRGNRWANSPAGLEYALNQIARVAGGRRGRSAVEAIVRQFERPAAPGAEIEKAFGRYGRVGKVGGGEAGPLGPSAPAAAQAAAPDRHLLAQQLVAMLGERHPDVGALIPLVAAARAKPKFAPVAVTPRPQRATPSRGATSERSSRGGIHELFYDPLGAIKNGASISPIGGHTDHVHMALGSEAAQRAAIRQAQKMGLHVGEDMDSNVHPVHVKDSYHYRHWNRGLRQAADVSGDARRMAAFYKWVQRRYG